MPSPADAPYSGLPPSGMFVTSLPVPRIDHRRRVRVAVEGEHAVRRGVVDDRVGILGGRNAAEHLERLQIEHDDRLVVARRRESVPGGRRDRRAVRAVDAGDFAEQLAVVLVDDHHAILPADEQTVIRRIGHDVVPAAVAAERVGLGDVIRRRRLCQHGCHKCHRQDECGAAHTERPSRVI